jgi:glycine/D-amino acid oxidase-like deaminating enzyme
MKTRVIFLLAHLPSGIICLFMSQQPNKQFPFSFRSPLWLWRRSGSAHVTNTNSTSRDDTLRVGILGGGIAGVSVAHALVEKDLRAQDKRKCEIVVIDGDPYACSNNLNKSLTNQWKAATARNANSMVPAAAMHVFSEKSALWNVLRDTLVELYELKREQLQSLWPNSTKKTTRSEQFAVAPPYFALHLLKCIGPTASSAERWSFITFMKHYLRASLLRNDAHERGKQLVALAAANRNLFLQYSQNSTSFSRGFLSLHRTADSAKQALDEIHDFGESAEIVSWDRALQLEPRLGRLPMEPLFAVYRTDDIISNCGAFVKSLVDKCGERGVSFRNATVKRVAALDGSKPKYRVTFEDGSNDDFDVVVLAAGIRNPLLAAGMGLGDCVPIYPLRGFSFTLSFEIPANESKKIQMNKPFSVDSMYCSSISPTSTRMAGFGEFVGYPEKAGDVPSLGPKILCRYSQVLFPEATNATLKNVLPCFRPMSPDDMPLAGEIQPGLFVHGGHGTLGWTLGLATGECVAQCIAEYFKGGQDMPAMYFEFPDGSKIQRSMLSPNRFVK